MKTPDSCIAIVGMPTSGKTTLGSHLAEAIGRPFADSDELFVAEQGTSINAYVARYGWSSFRSHEERIIEEAAQPNTVLSLGGGAIESGKTRDVLTIQAHVIWIRAQLQTILKRWKEQQRGHERPQLTSNSIEQETLQKYQRRNPLFESIADVVVEAEDSSKHQIEAIRTHLGL